VLATDWSPKMIEHFTARAAAEGHDAEGRVMDCHALELPDDTYDITGWQIQPVEAFASTSSVNNSEGFFQL
jgi:hypothetical protein